MNINDMLSIAKALHLGKSNEIPPKEAFINLIGYDQLRSICQIPELKLNYEHLVFSKKTISRIFLGIMHTQCLYPENPDQLTLLFFGKTPKLNQFYRDIALNSGRFRSGLRQRIFLLAHHHYQCQNEKNGEINRIREIELLTSRLADREIPKNTLLPLINGRYRVQERFIGGGAFIFLLRHVDDKFPPKLVCRGTSARPLATEGTNSCINDLQIQIGTGGIQTVWDKIHKYLIDHKITAVEVCGKSLGGAHAQQLAVLLEGIAKIQVVSLTTYCSVGVGRSINQLFKDHVLKDRSEPFNLSIIRNGGDEQAKNIDYVPLVGGVHLGADIQENCNISVAYIHPGQVDVAPIPSEMSLIDKIIKFCRSFSFAHTRQSTLSDFSFKKIDQSEIHEHLKMGNVLERIRKIVGYIFHYLTLGQFNGVSFRSYFQNKSSEFNSKFTI